MIRAAGLLLAALALAAPAAAAPPAIDPDLLARCARVVERIRKARFWSEVPATAITAGEYRDRMLADMERLLGGKETLRRLETLLRDVEQLGPDETIVGVAERFFPTSVAASYDPQLDRITVLRGFRSATLLCHELTHALDDQRHDLLAMFRDGPLEFDRLLALGALVEGSAETFTAIEFGEERERTEDVYVSWFATDGSFERIRSAAPAASVSWTPPEGAATVDLWFVVHDGRGGTDWRAARIIFE